MTDQPTLNSRLFALRLFGPPRLEGPSGVLTGPAAQRHRLALLALLAAAPRAVLSRDRLVGLLWPEMPEARARHLLSVAVHSIRRALGEHILLSEGEAIRLDRNELTIDLIEFERHLARGDDHAAVAEYAGPFCEGLALPDAVEFEQWQQREAARLEQSFHTALERLAEATARAGDHAQSIALWERRLACTPTDERVTLRLMRAMADAGNRGGALRLASVHKKLVSEQLATEPDPRIAALVADLQRPAGPPSEPLPNPSPAGLEFDHAHAVTGQVAHAELQGRPGRFMRPRVIGPLLAAVLLLSIVWVFAVRSSSAGEAVQPGAYDAWLRARYHLERRTAKDLTQCIKYADEATTVDPAFASGYGVKAACYLNGAAHSPGSSAAFLRLAAEAAQRALAIDPRHPGAHVALAWVAAARDRDWERAEQLVTRAIELDGGAVYPRSDYAYMLACIGRHGEAIARAREAATRDPVLPSALLNEARVLYLARRYDEAIAKANYAASLDATHFLVYERLAFAQSAQGRDELALTTIRKAVILAPEDRRLKGALGYMLARAGYRAEARAVMDSLARSGGLATMPPTSLAMLHLGLGETAAAVASLERAFREQDVEMMQLKVLPVWDALRDNPRFTALLARMNFPG